MVRKDRGFHRPANRDIGGFAIRTGKESIPEMDGDRILFFTCETGNGDGDARRCAGGFAMAYAVDDAFWNTAGGVLAAHEILAGIAAICGID